MRGNPLLHCILLALIWAGLAIPIRLVTSGQRVKQVHDEADASALNAWVSLRFSHRPESFSLSQSGAVIWSNAAPNGARFFEEIVPVRPDENEVELHVAGALTGDDAAVEVRIEADGYDPRSKTIWVSGQFDVPVRFSWRSDDGS